MTWARAERAARVVVNSVVFRSSGQNLTTVGTYIEMASRLLEPTLQPSAASLSADASNAEHCPVLQVCLCWSGRDPDVFSDVQCLYGH
jgi:hypothetical protein